MNSQSLRCLYWMLLVGNIRQEKLPDNKRRRSGKEKKKRRSCSGKRQSVNVSWQSRRWYLRSQRSAWCRKRFAMQNPVNAWRYLCNLVQNLERVSNSHCCICYDVVPYSITSIGHGADPSFLAVSLQVTLVINPVIGSRYFPPSLRLLFQPKRSFLGRYQIILLGDRGTQV